jgi:hypothetical protein
MLKKRTLAIFAAICLVAGFVWFFLPESQPKDLPQQMSILSHSLDSRMLKTQQWDLSDYALFIDDSGQPESRVSLMVQYRYKELKNRLRLYYAIPEARGLQSLLDASIVGMVIGGQYPTYRLNLINTYAASTTVDEMKQRLKVVYFGSDQWQKVLWSKSTAAAEYNPEIDALFIPCIDFANPSVRDALIFHELKHAQQRRQMQTLGVTSTDSGGQISDITADREVEAHRLGGKILDVGSQGEYPQRIQAVLAKYKAVSAVDLIMKIRKKDIIYIDEVFGEAGPIEAAMRRYGYFFNLGDAWIAANVPPDHRGENARQLYKELFYTQPKQ